MEVMHAVLHRRVSSLAILDSTGPELQVTTPKQHPVGLSGSQIIPRSLYKPLPNSLYV